MPPQPVESEFLIAAFTVRLFAASPWAAHQADPLMSTGLDYTPPVEFVIADIPDAEFREPSAILSIIDFAGGKKS